MRLSNIVVALCASLRVLASDGPLQNDDTNHNRRVPKWYDQDDDKMQVSHQEYHYTHTSRSRQHGGKNNDDTTKSKRPKIHCVFASWFAPMISLIFVVSFELGRRNRKLGKAKQG